MDRNENGSHEAVWGMKIQKRTRKKRRLTKKEIHEVFLMITVPNL